MTSSRVIVIAVALLLTSLDMNEGQGLMVEPHCRCIMTESKPIVRHIEKVELVSPNSHCEDTEIIATLKSTCKRVCLDPEAPWVKKLIQRIMSNQTTINGQGMPPRRSSC